MRFSTIGLPREQRVARWEEHNAQALIGLRCRPLDDVTLEATELNLQLPRLHLARVTSNPHVVERTATTIRKTPSEAIACYLTLLGEAFFYHHDGVRTAHPGQLIICDADRPFMRGFSQGLEELAVKVPRQVFTDVTGLESVRQPLVLDFAQGDVHARTLAQLVGRAVRPEGSHPVDEDTLLGLLGGLATGRPTDLAAVHLATAKAYIEDRLTDQNLTAAQVAKGIGISQRHLSRVFSSRGSSVPRYLLTRRLERAHALLSEDGELTVGEVAARCGFGSAAYFSHAFSDHYGLRATDVRRLARIHGSATPSDSRHD
ncbi:AraC family transcriptional regulator [Planosporangium mesophilum]|uniref:AraC family transcriptional regulator n=1 Tax=Planosporangium mesophilum TaxID=689768 RepID=A0A8J3TEM6_9ACTN|nr:AraC family transcriptional regulator [Planosporangium mesophilum]